MTKYYAPPASAQEIMGTLKISPKAQREARSLLERLETLERKVDTMAKEVLQDFHITFGMPVKIYEIEDIEYCEFRDVVGETITIDLAQASEGGFIG